MATGAKKRRWVHLFVTLVKTVLTATLCHKCHRGRFLAFLVEQTGDLQSLSIVFLNYLFLPLAHRSESMSCRTLWSEHGKSPVKRTCKSPLIKRNCPGFKTSSKAKQLTKQSETFGRHVGCFTNFVLWSGSERFQTEGFQKLKVLTFSK